jgi:mono/diheme cytochrome c family protein
MKRWITSGMPGTQMPAFGESAGGFLTPHQVDELVAGMRTRWDHRDHRTANMPLYSSNAAGNVAHGQDIFQMSCSSCHQQGRQEITDPSYLSLISDQSLRTVIIAGRPDLGHPDWKQVRPSQPLNDQDVGGVIAFLHSLRSDTPGQPYPETSIKR